MVSRPRSYSIGTLLAWLAVIAAGGVALAILATAQGEKINALWVIVASVCVFALAWRFHSAWLMARVLTLDNMRATPAVRRDDGRDYVPTNRWVTFGHHFAAIARARHIAKLQHIAHGFNTNLTAGFTLFVVNLFLRLFTQRPCSFNHFCLGHQHPEVGMNTHSYAVTTGALTACALRCGCLAQPALSQSQGQVILTQAS
jgi:hypothetical protein